MSYVDVSDKVFSQEIRRKGGVTSLSLEPFILSTCMHLSTQVSVSLGFKETTENRVWCNEPEVCSECLWFHCIF